LEFQTFGAGALEWSVARRRLAACPHVGAASIGEHRRRRCERFATPSRAVSLADHGGLPDPLPVAGRRPPLSGRLANVAPPPTLKQSERRLILKTLETVGWVIGGTHGAAAALGLHRTTLINRMRKLGIMRAARPRPVDGEAMPADPPEPQH
jgi:transcriptional regulator with GAF, ATPase, and Fis domain